MRSFLYLHLDSLSPPLVTKDLITTVNLFFPVKTLKADQLNWQEKASLFCFVTKNHLRCEII